MSRRTGNNYSGARWAFSDRYRVTRQPLSTKVIDVPPSEKESTMSYMPGSINVIGYEARCTKCGEGFCPNDPTDLEHLVRDDGNECGGAGEMVGSWGSARPPKPDCKHENGRVTYRTLVVAEIRDGEIWSVKVADEDLLLEDVYCDECGQCIGLADADRAARLASPLLTAAETDTWPSWQLGL